MTTDGRLVHDARARVSARQRRLLADAHRVMVKEEKKQAKAEKREPVQVTEAHVIRLALDHLVETHPAFAEVKAKQSKRAGG
jgi:hypothetical protein